MLGEYAVCQTDVLVVGSGGAGLRSAIAAANGAKVTIATKGPYARSGASLLAGADVMLDGKSLSELGFPGKPDDSKEKFFKDVLIEGFFLNNQKLVESFVDDAPARVKELIDWGMEVFGMEDERALMTNGVQILNALRRETKRKNVEVLEHHMITDLLVDDARINGALALNLHTGEIIVIKAKAVVIATGGWQSLFSFNTASDELSGDGLGAAYRAGADLINLEMITFCPDVILYPPRYKGSIFLYILHSLVGGRLLDNRGERFMLKYDPRVFEIATTTEWNKLIISRATICEVEEGKGSPHGGVWYSLNSTPWNLVEEAQEFFPDWKFQGTNYSPLMEKLREGYGVEVGAAGHYFEGGIKINENGETNIAGLYAAGECTGGLFGANRVSAATTEMIVQGARAGRNATKYAQETRVPDPSDKKIQRAIERVLQPLRRKDGASPLKLRKTIQEAAYDGLGVIRDGSKLERLIEKIEEAKTDDSLKLVSSTKRPHHNKEWVEALEVNNLLQILDISAKSALKREESRGVHYRRDYPEVNNDEWLKTLIVRHKDGRIEFRTEPVVTTDMKLPSGTMSYDDSIKKAVRDISHK